jgi:hypothetical protein
LKSTARTSERRNLVSLLLGFDHLPVLTTLEKEKRKNELESLKEQKQKEKEEAEAPEKEALDYYRQLEEEERKKRVRNSIRCFDVLYCNLLLRFVLWSQSVPHHFGLGEPGPKRVPTVKRRSR